MKPVTLLIVICSLLLISLPVYAQGDIDGAAATPLPLTPATTNPTEGESADAGNLQDDATLPEATSIPAVMAQVEPSTGTVGDVLTYSARITWPEGINVIPPDRSEKLGDCRVLDRKVGDLTTKDGIHKLDLKLSIACYKTGELTIPPVTIHFDDANGERRSLDGPETKVNILRTLPEDVKELKPIKPIKDMPPDYRTWALILLGMLLLCMVAYFIYTWLRNRKKALEKERINTPVPYDFAVDRFESGNLEKMLKEENLDGFYVELTDILREYLEGRYDIQALEMTTRETSRALSDTPLDNFLKTDLRNILNRGDYAKFANIYPQMETCKNDIGLGREFVEKTRPALEPREQEKIEDDSNSKTPEIVFDTDKNSGGKND